MLPEKCPRTRRPIRSVLFVDKYINVAQFFRMHGVLRARIANSLRASLHRYHIVIITKLVPAGYYVRVACKVPLYMSPYQSWAVFGAHLINHFDE